VLDVITAWSFQFKSVGFVWVKLNPSGEGLFTSMGFGTRANTEFVLLATRGAPLRLNADVHQVVMAPVGAHSEKPEEIARRIERLFPGPYLELFARRPRKGWMTWGNEIAPPPLDPQQWPTSPTAPAAPIQTPPGSAAAPVRRDICAGDDGGEV
jgi:N6-adenosine-specific RNA methylase IME4